MAETDPAATPTTSPAEPRFTGPMEAAIGNAGDRIGTPPPAGAARSSGLVCFVRYLYTSNPFYAISAALILLGLNLIFHDEAAVQATTAVDFNSWLLLYLIGGYALVLAGAALLMVRLGKVWDDARTIMLILVLLFVALSINFDKLMLTNAATFVRVLLVGLAFSIGLSELVLRGLRIRLPVIYRGPYYLFLALFYLYPVVLVYLLDTVGDTDNELGRMTTRWGILLFPSVAALAALTLLPAACRGPASAANNGTPWRWPLFPWSLFVFLGTAVVLRSYYLTVSFHAHPGVQSEFGVFLLVPFLLAAALILFEIGRSVHCLIAQNLALLGPLVLLPLSMPNEGKGQRVSELLNVYVERFGSPVLVAWWGLLALYVWGWLRGTRWAERGVTVILLVGTVLGRDTYSLASLQAPAGGPLAAVALMLLAQALWNPKSSGAWFAVAATLIGSAAADLRGTSFTAFHGAIPLHLVLACTLFLGTLFDDAFAVFLRRLGGWGLCAAGALALFGRAPLAAEVPDLGVVCYLALLSLVAWGLVSIRRDGPNLLVAVAVTACLLGEIGMVIVAFLRTVRNPAGFLLTIGGVASFLVAATITSTKARRRLRLAGQPDIRP